MRRGRAEVVAAAVGGRRGVDEVVGRGEVCLERDVGFLVLVFPRVAVPVADVHADDQAPRVVDEGVEFVAAFGDVGGVGAVEVKEGFEAGADEGEDGFLAEGFGFVGGLEALVKCSAERPAGGGGRDDEVFGVVRARQAVGGRWWEAGRRWCWLEIGCVVSIYPGFGRSASLKEKRVRINEEIPVRVIDEKSSAFFLGQAI